jgi:PIN domain nuclease of toxin-antitoxin system
LILAVADTHALIWYLFGDPRLSTTARATIEGAASSGDQVAVSSISLAEVVYLCEKGRIDPTALDQILALIDGGGLLVESAVDRAIVSTMRTVDRAIVPEMPDRIIVATALHLGIPLINRDMKIRASRATIL